MKSRVVRIIAVVLALMIGTSGWIIGMTRRHSGESSSPQSAIGTSMDQPFAVTLASPGSTAQFGTVTPLAVSVTDPRATDVRRIELWDGGRVVDVREFDTTGDVQAMFRWPAASLGSHLLFARAITDSDTVAYSPTVSVNVAAAEWQLSRPPSEFPVADGIDTAALAAANLGVDPALLIVDPTSAEPVTAADQPDAPVSGVVGVGLPGVPVVPATSTEPKVVQNPPDQLTTPDQPNTPDQPPAGQQPGTDSPVGLPGGFLLDGVSIPPGPYEGLKLDLPDLPTGSVELDGCRVSIMLDDPITESGKVFHASSGTGGLVLFGTMKKGQKSFSHEPLMPGVHVFIVRDGQTSATDPLVITVPQSCAEQAGWVGDISLINGVLHVPAPAKGYYLYVGFVGQKAQFRTRIPSDDREYIDAPTTDVDISAMLPYFGNTTTLQLDLWRSVGFSSEHIATATMNVPAGSNVYDIVGWPQDLDLYVGGYKDGPRRTQKLSKDGTVEFTYVQSRGQGIVWQVLGAPVAPTNTSLSPPGLVATGVIAHAPEVGSMGAGFKSATFTIDTAKIPHFGYGGFAEMDPNIPVASPPPPDLTELENSEQWAVEASKVDWSAGLTPAEIQTLIAEFMGKKPASEDLWVRALTVDNGAVVGVASPMVQLDFDTPTPKSPLTVTSVTVDPPRIPNYAWEKCAAVVVPWDDPNWGGVWGVDPSQYAQLRDTYPDDGTYCRVDVLPTELDTWEELVAIGKGFGEQMVSIYDSVQAAYNAVIGTLSTLLAQWNPICDLPGVDKASCQQWTKVAASAVIKAGLAVLGLPPSLPTSSAIYKSAVSAIEGDLTTTVSEWMKSVGVPCDSIADDSLTAEAAKAAFEKAGIEVSKDDATEDGGLDLCKVAIRGLLKKAESEIRTSYQSNASVAAGGPSVPFTIKGFSISPEPVSYWSPFVATINAAPTPKGPTTPQSCVVPVKPWFKYRSTTATLGVIGGLNIWAGQAVFMDDSSKIYGGNWLDKYESVEKLVNEGDVEVTVTVEPNACTGAEPASGSALLLPPVPDPEF